MNRKELIRSLRELAQELGKDTLTQKDIKESEISTYWVRKHFRTMASAMEAAGLQPSKLARSMATSDEELLDYLDDLQRRLGQRPTYLDIDREGRFSQRIFSSRFGSLDSALAQLKERGVRVEEHPRVQPRSREELVRTLQEIAQQHGDRPLREKDIKAYGLSPYWVRKHFKNLGSALMAAGLQPSKLAKSMATSNDELLDYLDDLQRRLGRRPTYLDIDGEGRFSQRIFFSRFGSLENALSRLKEQPAPVEEHPDVQPPSLTNKIAQAVQEYEGGWQQRLEELEQIAENLTEENQKLRAELVALQAALQEERESPPSPPSFERRIVDEELRGDCAEFLKRQDTYADAIRRASVVLEERLREAVLRTGAKATYGATLVRLAFSKESGRLIISEVPAEQEGVLQLFSGAFAFVRNPPAHKKVQYTEMEVWHKVSLIDYLLSLLRQAKSREKSSRAAPRRLPEA